MAKITGKIGDNYKVADCPFHLPKENMKFFGDMQTAADQEPYANYSQYGNAYIHKKK